MRQIPTKNRYSLQLSNNNCWSIFYTDDSSSIIEKMADIMRLSHSDNTGNRLIYVRDISKSGTLIFDGITGLEDLPAEGWSTTLIGHNIISTHSNIPDIVCDLGPEKDPIIEIFKISDSLFSLYRYELQFGGLPIHSALIERDNQGVLLAARNNTGKSTCCRRIPEPWHALCDDEALVVKSSASHYEAHPFPTWSDFLLVDRPTKSLDVQSHIPLKAFFFLEQALNDKVTPLKHGEAASRIYYSARQAYYRMLVNADPEFNALLKKQLFDNACEMSRHIPSYVLKVSLNGKFWEEIDKVLPTI